MASFEGVPGSLIVGIPYISSGSGIDAAYTFGRRPTTRAPFPFSTREFARLLALRSRVQAGEVHEGSHP